MPQFEIVSDFKMTGDQPQAVERLANGYYRFMVDGEAVYVSWGSGEIPAGIVGDVLTTDIYGTESRTDRRTVTLTDTDVCVILLPTSALNSFDCPDEVEVSGQGYVARYSL